ncbi:YadA family autotransporter adhesin [Paraburkholderia bannensis]|uniref:YadA family autotransporter adhesin n=1 Tax=Paraburkholderia bannensis TaxID=765414 RepID=UPI002ABE529B|nr:YadA-like family protein [Paraburkholderia bannensis]
MLGKSIFNAMGYSNSQIVSDRTQLKIFLSPGTATGTDGYYATLSNGQTGVLFSGLNAGLSASDAVNVSQLTGVTKALGAGASVDSSSGSIVAPSYAIGGATYNDVGSALGALKSATQDDLKYDSSAHDSVTLGGVGASAPVALHNVANGSVTAASTDAVNGSQLYQVSNSVTNINNTLTTAGWGAQASSTNPASYEMGGFILEGNGHVSNPAVLYVPNTIGTANAQIVLDPGLGNSEYFVNGDRTQGYLPKGTVISNVADGLQNTDAANLGQVYTIVAEAGSGGSGGGLLQASRQLQAPLGASAGGSGVNTSGLVLTYNTAAFYSQVSGLADSSGSTKPSDVARAYGNGSIAIGSNSYVPSTAPAGTAIGVQSYTSANDAVALGSGSVANVANSLDAVNGSQLYATNVQISNLNQAIENINVSGSEYLATNTSNGAASATGTNSVAAGGGAVASGANSTAIGDTAKATGNNSVALGANSVADQDNTVSVGSQGNERRITNVANGVNATDAVNVGQLQSGLNALQGNVNSVARNAYGGVAAATALTMIPDVDQGKNLAVGVGTANFQGYQAVALGASARITQNIKVKVGGGYASGGGATVGGGMAYQW